MSKIEKNPDTPDGTQPFKFTMSVFKIIKEGKKIMKLTLGEYHLIGFSRKRNHVNLVKIEKECGEIDPDIMPDLEMMDNPEKMEEFEMVARNYVNRNYWNATQLEAVK